MININTITSRLSALPVTHQVAFGAFCAERLMPDYIAFSIMEHWGNPTVLRHALDLAWTFVRGSEVSPQECNQMVHQCNEIIPDVDAFDSPFTGIAMRAAASVTYVLESCISQPTQIHWVVEETFEVLRQYISIVTHPIVLRLEMAAEVLNWVETSPLIHLEYLQQGDILSYLEATPDLDSSSVALLVETARQGGIQLIHRGIVRHS